MTKDELFDIFIQAINKNNFEMVKKCVEAKVDVNRCYDMDGSTPLYLCLRRSKDSKIFDYLVEHGADVTKKIGHPKMKDAEKPSLLSFTMKFSNVPEAIMRTILKNGGDIHVNYAAKGEKSPLQKAFENKDVRILKIFSEYTDIYVGLEKISDNIGKVGNTVPGNTGPKNKR